MSVIIYMPKAERSLQLQCFHKAWLYLKMMICAKITQKKLFSPQYGEICYPYNTNMMMSATV